VTDLLATRRLKVVLISTYDLGHQPFGIASPAAWLRADGASVTCLDLAVEHLDEDAVRAADVIAFYAPMHTATRMVATILPRARQLAPSAHVCVYGLYAPMNRDYLGSLGVDSVLGGEFEAPLRDLIRDLATAPGGSGRPPAPPVSLGRQQFMIPDRSGLPALPSYAGFCTADGTRKTSGYTEATRGCKHLCRHCPVVPVYGGRFRVVQEDVVLGDIAQQVQAGAEHITFGDPDFFNAPGHAVAVVTALHRAFPSVTYDVTIKIEHLVRHARYVPVLRDTGCALVTSAVEAIDEGILEIFDKRHTVADLEQAIALLAANGIALNPTFVAITPWTTRDLYIEFLTAICRLGLVANVSPIQYAIRLLIPEGSLLLDRPELKPYLGEFDPGALCYRWAHPDPGMDQLSGRLLDLVAAATGENADRGEIFRQICEETADLASPAQRMQLRSLNVAANVERVPQMSEPWYCCAEPVNLTPSPPDQY
jgi:radical SAM superfamily enzyme YgiQ (UPF0313 family)